MAEEKTTGPLDGTNSSGDDLSNFGVKEDGAEMIVRHPITEKPLVDENGDPWTIRLDSSYSDRYEKALHRVQNRRLKKRKLRMTAEEIEEGNLECLVAVTLDWSGITVSGEKLEFNAKNAYQLFSEHKFIRDQATDFVEDQANFLPS